MKTQTSESEKKDKTFYISKVLHFCGIGPVVNSANTIITKNDNKQGEIFWKQASIYRLKTLESFLESYPQMILQTYILLQIKSGLFEEIAKQFSKDKEFSFPWSAEPIRISGEIWIKATLAISLCASTYSFMQYKSYTKSVIKKNNDYFTVEKPKIISSLGWLLGGITQASFVFARVLWISALMESCEINFWIVLLVILCRTVILYLIFRFVLQRNEVEVYKKRVDQGRYVEPIKPINNLIASGISLFGYNITDDYAVGLFNYMLFLLEVVLRWGVYFFVKKFYFWKFFSSKIFFFKNIKHSFPPFNVLTVVEYEKTYYTKAIDVAPTNQTETFTNKTEPLSQPQKAGEKVELGVSGKKDHVYILLILISFFFSNFAYFVYKYCFIIDYGDGEDNKNNQTKSSGSKVGGKHRKRVKK